MTDFDVPMEHNSDGDPCHLVIACETGAVRHLTLDLCSQLAGMVRGDGYPDATRDAAHKAYDALVELSKHL